MAKQFSLYKGIFWPSVTKMSYYALRKMAFSVMYKTCSTMNGKVSQNSSNAPIWKILHLPSTADCPVELLNLCTSKTYSEIATET